MDIIRRRHRIIGVLVVLGVFAISFLSAQAAPLTVEPVVTRMTVLPGWEWLGSVRITNSGSEEVQVQIDSMNLISGTEPGDPPVPIIGESTVEREVSLAGWMRLPIKQARIAPQSSVRIPVAIIVPSYAGHGVHHAAVTFRQEGIRPSDSGAEVAATITSGFAVDVIGDNSSRHEMDLVLFGTKMFTTSFPVDLRVRVENNGTTLGVLDGQVNVSSMLGLGGVQFPVSTAEEGRYLKPGSSYENTYTLTDAAVGSGAGLYRADIRIVNGGDILEDTNYFVVVPAPLAVMLLATLMISIGGARFAVRRSRKKER